MHILEDAFNKSPPNLRLSEGDWSGRGKGRGKWRDGGGGTEENSTPTLLHQSVMGAGLPPPNNPESRGHKVKGLQILQVDPRSHVSPKLKWASSGSLNFFSLVRTEVIQLRNSCKHVSLFLGGVEV